MTASSFSKATFWNYLPWAPLVAALALLFALPGICSRMEPPAADSDLRGWLVLGTGGVSNNSGDFRAGDVMAVLGGYRIDLSKAGISGGAAVIRALAIFGKSRSKSRRTGRSASRACRSSAAIATPPALRVPRTPQTGDN